MPIDQNPASPQAGAAPAAARIRTAPKRAFAWWIALPTVLVFVSACVLTYITLMSMGEEINRLDAAHGQSAVEAATGEMLATLADSASDEGTWNEAYLNTYFQLNPAWLDATWGSTARIGLNYDNVIVTDAGGGILFGEHNQGALTGHIADHFTGAIHMIDELGATIAEQGDAATIAHFSQNDDGPVALAAIVIHRSTPGEMTVPTPQRRILWLARHLTPSLLSAIAARYQIAPPVFAAAADPSRQTVPLIDASGTSVGVLAWQPSRPGDLAFLHAAAGAAVALMVIGALMFLLLRQFFKTITRLAEGAAEDWHVARFDPFTGLLSRFGLIERLDAILHAGPTPMPVAVTHVGVDDVGGYSGDKRVALLDQIAALLKSHAPNDANAARVAADQFTVGFAGDDARVRAQEYADKITDTASRPMKFGDDEVQIRLNAGVVDVQAERGGGAEALRLAELAMVAARAVAAAPPKDVLTAETRQRRMKIASEMRRALDKDEFDLDYQPIVDFATQSIFAVEALLRWKRRPEGALDPLEFMDAALASGLADELGILTLRRAAREIGPFEALLLCVNVATQQFRNPDLPEQIGATLAATRFPASRLQLEITESLLHDFPDQAIAAIGQLRARGISIALDDFGAGNSSLAHLQKFGIDRVKLDRAIVDQIDNDAAKYAMAQGIMTIAQSVNLKVTAEGVERRQEAATLAGLGCREFQGYLFARPMPLDALKRLLEPQAAAARKAS